MELHGDIVLEGNSVVCVSVEPKAKPSALEVIFNITNVRSFLVEVGKVSEQSARALSKLVKSEKRRFDPVCCC